ncbi:hypothetical protein Bca52824_086997 [Brassica carinata]|uniref:Uncharacterized protein n=1 Tax=Brassica carinata TaxID=52824 RepID=A0A8X7P7B3_BRACI|nr:hypothetical protein Bca52824_086997 [Brassica carinata]
MDKDEQRGKDLTNLFIRMKESKIALVIFSSSLFKSLQHIISRSPSFGNKSSKVDVLIVCVESEFGRSNDSKMNFGFVGLTKAFYSQYEISERDYKEIRERRKMSELC